MDAARNRVLQTYDVPLDAQLSSGMEAEGYAYGSDAILKLYPGTISLTDLHILRDFYNSLDRQRVPYALPRIHTVIHEEPFLISIEQRLPGTPMSARLPMSSDAQLALLMQQYLTASIAISHIAMPATCERYKLFDSDNISAREQGDWHQFLGRYLTHKLAQVEPYLHHDVPRFAENVRQLRTLLDQPYHGDYRLIHGDFFPGNLLINDEYEITALLDFGLLTMYGDYLFDLATGWVFFDMYDEFKMQMRERYLALLLDRLGVTIRGKLYRYILIYSILSANTYSSTCSDGHYHWCVANLSNQQYWKAIE